MFEIRIDTLKFINAQRKQCANVTKRSADVSSYSHMALRQPTSIEKKRTIKSIKILIYGVLLKYCSLPLQNSIRGIEGFSATVRDEDVITCGQKSTFVYSGCDAECKPGKAVT